MTDTDKSLPTQGWTRTNAPSGRYEYQFQGRTPTVRNAQYHEAHDYQFLVMDVEGWLYKIPVRMADEAEEEMRKARQEPMALAEDQLRAGLREFTPRQGAPYDEMDSLFSIDGARAREWLEKK